MASSNPHLVFFGSYARSDQTGIYAYHFDDTTGALTELISFPGILNPSYITIHPNGRWLYAVSEISLHGDGLPGAVYALELDAATGVLTLLNRHNSGGDWPCHLVVDGTGKWLMVANYGSGSPAVLPIGEDGALRELTERVQHQGKGPNPQRQEGPHAHSTTMTPDNQYAIVADLGIDQLVMYRFDASRGKLNPHREIHTAPGAGPRHLAFHPNGQVVYVANELANTVTAFAYDASNGNLTELQTLATVPPRAPESTVADIHVSSSGDRVYVSNRGHDSIAVFAADAAGKLSSLVIQSCGGQCPRNFALAPGGKFIVVANQNSNDVSVLPLRVGGDEIGAPVTRVAVSRASCVKFA